MDGKPFVGWAEHILTGLMPWIHVHNGGVAGTLSSYMAACQNVHLHPRADIVFVDYSLNDPVPGSAPLMNNFVVRPYERLLRKLLSHPRCVYNLVPLYKPSPCLADLKFE